ncbi:DUF2501 domain-containing protein [Paraburkholderia dinghuensis]|uniref:DUF2501 domain-containing protein n=1 Tax=Paraburkholderia dinghuensis TaxID=2305225 RepID=A0A3N6NC35_9BURK|nr:DUF2501 domain-containing protein [Paraburkholderia dinghuensis]RQH06512.1 DUF2501 domain-containing protein [Paraburkholderia dinghuensis]
MQTSTPRTAALFAIGLLLTFGVAHAQFGNLLNQGGNSGTAGNALGNLGGLSSSLSGASVTSSSLGNVTGVLSYCIKNNFLSAGSASSVQNSLLSKLPGGANTTDSGYQQGTNGILTAGNGSHIDLSGSGLKEAATREVCDKILTQAKSML